MVRLPGRRQSDDDERQSNEEKNDRGWLGRRRSEDDSESNDNWNFARERYGNARRGRGNEDADDSGSGFSFLRRNRGDDDDNVDRSRTRGGSFASGGARRPSGGSTSSRRSSGRQARGRDDKDDKEPSGGLLGRFRRGGKNEDDQTEDRLTGRRGSQSRRPPTSGSFRRDRDTGDSPGTTSRQTGTSFRDRQQDRDRPGTGSSTSSFRRSSQSRRAGTTSSPFRSERDTGDSPGATSRQTGTSFRDRQQDRDRPGTGTSTSSFRRSSQSRRPSTSSSFRRDRDTDDKKDAAADRRPGSSYQSRRPSSSTTSYDRSRTGTTGTRSSTMQRDRPGGGSPTSRTPSRQRSRTQDVKKSDDKSEEKKGGIFSRFSRGKKSDEKKDEGPNRFGSSRSRAAGGAATGAAATRRSQSRSQSARAKPSTTGTSRRSSRRKSTARTSSKDKTSDTTRRLGRRARPADTPKKRSRAGARRSDPLPEAKAKGAFTLHQGLDLDRKIDLIGLTLVVFAMIAFSAVLPSMSFGVLPQPEGGLSGTVNDILSQVFGLGKIVLPIVAFGVGVWLMAQSFEGAQIELDYFRIVGMISLYACALAWLQMIALFGDTQPSVDAFRPISRSLALDGGGGGWIGHQIYLLLLSQLLDFGTVSVLIAWLVMSLMLTFDLSVVELMSYVMGLFGFLRIDPEARARRRAAKEAMATEAMAAMRPGEEAGQLTLEAAAAGAGAAISARTEAASAPAVPDPNSPPKPPSERRRRRFLRGGTKSEPGETKPEAAESAESEEPAKKDQQPARSGPVINRRFSRPESAESTDKAVSAQGISETHSAEDTADEAEGPARRRMPRLRRTDESTDTGEDNADTGAISQAGSQDGTQEEKRGGKRFGFLRRGRGKGDAEASEGADDAKTKAAESGESERAAKSEAANSDAIPAIPVPPRRRSDATSAANSAATEASESQEEDESTSLFGRFFRRSKPKADASDSDAEIEQAEAAAGDKPQAKPEPAKSPDQRAPTRPDRIGRPERVFQPSPFGHTPDAEADSESSGGSSDADATRRFGRPRPDHGDKTESARDTGFRRPAAAFDRPASRSSDSPSEKTPDKSSDSERPRRRMPALRSPFADVDDEASDAKTDEKTDRDDSRADQRQLGALAAAGAAGALAAATVQDRLSDRRAPTSDSEADEAPTVDSDRAEQFQRRVLSGLRTEQGEERSADWRRRTAEQSSNGDTEPSDSSDEKTSPVGSPDTVPDSDKDEVAVADQISTEESDSEQRARPSRPDLQRRRQKLTERQRAARFAPAPKMGSSAAQAAESAADTPESPAEETPATPARAVSADPAESPKAEHIPARPQRSLPHPARPATQQEPQAKQSQSTRSEMDQDGAASHPSPSRPDSQSGSQAPSQRGSRARSQAGTQPESRSGSHAETEAKSKPAATTPSIRRPTRTPEPAEVSGDGANKPEKRAPRTALKAGPPQYDLPDRRKLLRAGDEQRIDDNILLDKARVIEDTLSSFGAPGKVVEVNPGPVITQFGIEPGYLEGRGGKRTRVKVGSIARLDADLALALAAKTIRIEAPVPGKGFVGIEVPNDKVALVGLRDIMESPEFRRIDSKLRIALGLGVDGTPVAADLTMMPHLLIAGTTGSGKSVCVNSIISCLLLENKPEDVQFIMVDPKRVELTGYNGIPHLVAPVVVDLERIVGVLQWIQREMEERYRKFASIAARNIVDYNNKINDTVEKMPYYVVIVDELADLMMLAPDETERLLARLAQMARATGIHLVISTQRPSVDIITGLIKANFPARIAFAVASSVDSRVILDQPGAEKLLGRGDMLYQSPDAAAPLRMQGVFVSDEEITALTRYWRGILLDQADAAGSREILASPSRDITINRDTPFGVVEEEKQPEAPRAKSKPAQPSFWDQATSGESASTSSNGNEDELYGEATELVQRLQKASISLLQRRLRIGYTRAARLIDMMEADGIVGPAESGSKPREVLLPKPAAESGDD